MASQTVKVTIRGAKSLAVKDDSAFICECMVDGLPQTKFRTAASKEHSSEPVWNHQAELPDVDVSEDSLVFAVRRCEASAPGSHGENFIGKANDVIGKVTLPATRFFPDGFDGDLELPGAGPSGSSALLSLAVAAEPAPAIGVPREEGQERQEHAPEDVPQEQEPPQEEAAPAARVEGVAETAEPTAAQPEELPVIQSVESCEQRGAEELGGDPPPEEGAASDGMAEPGQPRVSDEEVRAAMEEGLDKELEARVRERAYFLWKNGSKKGADADYFEALRSELSQAPEPQQASMAAQAGGA